MFHIENKDGITSDQLNKIPAIFSDSAASHCSDKYNQISTIDIIESLKPKGWNPVWIGQCKTRDIDKLDKTKHMVKFRNFDKDLTVGDSVIELLLKNSHNTQSSVSFMTGLFRFLCANEMVTCDSVVPTIRMRHVGLSMSDVLKGADQMLKSVDLVKENINKMQGTQLDQVQRGYFAANALRLRYPDVNDRPIDADQLLITRRESDRGSDLWTTFNKIQENVIRGRIPYIKVGIDTNGNRTIRHQKTKPVKAIDQMISLNKGIHALSQAYL